MGRARVAEGDGGEVDREEDGGEGTGDEGTVRRFDAVDGLANICLKHQKYIEKTCQV